MNYKFLGSQCLIKHHNSLTWQLWLRYGFYVGAVHGAAVLQAGGSDAQSVRHTYAAVAAVPPCHLLT